MTAARKHGWKERRKLHVIHDKKAEPVLEHAYGNDYWDACDDGWYGCGMQGCCVDEDWAVNVMPPMIFTVDGLVHVSQPKHPTAACGAEGNWPVPALQSTDEAIAYAKKFHGDFRQITCLVCITYAPYRGIAWSGP